MDANSGNPWSEEDVRDLQDSLDYGDTFAEAAGFKPSEVISGGERSVTRTAVGGIHDCVLPASRSVKLMMCDQRCA
jgi:hypothetical protein